MERSSGRTGARAGGFLLVLASLAGGFLAGGKTPAAPPTGPLHRTAAAMPLRTQFIDRGWLAARGAAPYLLDTAGTTYVLRTDVRAEGTAFVVGAAGVTLDLNGHTVTYGDGVPPTVVNGGFEEGSGRSVPGWDLRAAPCARLASNTRYLFGRRVLRLASFRTPQQLLSDPIKVFRPGRAHTATITPANPDTHCSVTLSVLDAATGKVLGTGTSTDPARGFSAVAHFTPGSASAVRLRVDVVPVGGATTSLDLDGATLAVSGDHGVLASRTWPGNLPGWGGLPRHIQAAYQRKRAARFTLKNGRLLQGRGAGYASAPLFFRELPGVTVEAVETFACGMDTATLVATGAIGPVIVRRSTFRERIGNVSRRMNNLATLELANIRGPILVEGNRLLGSPQIGIMLAWNDPRWPARIRRNEIRQDTIVTNGYAILCSATRRFEISDNTIRPISGRGICLDGFSAGLLAQGEIRDNIVEVQERPNREYPSGMSAMALRLRNTVDRQGPHRELTIRGNLFAARCGPGLVREAAAGRISYANRGGAMNDAGIVLAGNTFRAVAATSDPAFRARALVLDRIDPGINLAIRDNVLESNDVSLALADRDGGVEGVTLLGTTLRRFAAAPRRPYAGILAGYYNRDVRGVRLVDTRREGGATASVVWAGTGSREVQTGWLLSVRVVDGSGRPVPGAAVSVRDREGREVASASTGPDGTAREMAIITTVCRPGTGHGSEERRGPHRVRAVHSGAATECEIDLSASRTVTLPLRSAAIP